MIFVSNSMFEKSTGSFDACLNCCILETGSMLHQLSLKTIQARWPAERSSDPLIPVGFNV